MLFAKTFRDVLERNEQLYGDEPAVLYAGRRISFRELAVRARRFADALYTLGLRHQDRLSVLAMNCLEYVELYSAAEVGGFICAPINFRLAPAETVYVVNDCAPRALVFESQYASMLEAIRPQLASVRHFICLGPEVPAWAESYEALLDAGRPQGPPIRPGARDLLTILYTSGTTGRPKGVMTSHEAGLWAALMQSMEMATDVGGKFLIVMPMYHLAGRLMQQAQHLRGGTVVLHRQFDPLEIVRTIERERITEVHLAPTMLQAVLDVPDIDRYDLSSVKTLQHAAAPIPLALRVRALAKFGPILIDGFGQTEGGGTVLRKNRQKIDGTAEERKRLASVGQPMLHAELRIVDAEDNEVPVGTVGEICFKTPQNMLGYWNNGAATVETLRNGWLHTGDMGYVDAEQFLYLVDRKKDMIISGGENVYSREVEEALTSHAAVADAAVIGVPDRRWGEAVMAVIVCRAGATLTSEAINLHCRSLIAAFKCPKHVVFARDLPRVPSGKVNKVALREHYGSRQAED